MIINQVVDQILDRLLIWEIGSRQEWSGQMASGHNLLLSNSNYYDTRNGNKMSNTSVILNIEVHKNKSSVFILLLHLFIEKHLMMFRSTWKSCVTYSVSHNSIHHPEFSGNQGNHHNFVSSSQFRLILGSP